MSKVKHLFNQIESIKSTMSMKNGNKPELWIQRQNLQDLYHQIILNDIDFTIDKKLEQDLWNLVFKSQINYFQTQIKENSSTVSSSSNAQSNNQNQSIKTNKIISSQKKYEAQASLFFFLEAARGFYTKLLEDIVFTYDSKEVPNSIGSVYLLPFSHRFQSIFNRINDSITSQDLDLDSSKLKTAKEKQILYICQHILTHLGDIARYANLFQQAKNYYLHAIVLVPYLGHPYNQLGILFETSRTNQLSTVFYYFRSIAVRYKFPLATTNLENFLTKLIDIPLTRYNPTNIDLNQPNLIKLAHKDLITLYLQIDSLIYFQTNAVLSNKKVPMDVNKIMKYIDLFKYTFEAFVKTPLQRDKLDSFQLCEMISIAIYLVSTSTESTAVKLFCYLVEIISDLYKDNAELVLPSLYLAFNYLELCDVYNLVVTNKLWLQNVSSEQNSKFLYSIANLLNSLQNEVNKSSTVQLLNLNRKYTDYPLNEDRMLDSFIPLKYYQVNLNITKYLRSNQLLSDSDEDYLRKKRLVNCMERILLKDELKQCYLQLDNASFKVTEQCELFDLVKKDLKVIDLNESMETSSSKQATVAREDQNSLPRRRRQNVAIFSITQKNLNQKIEANKTVPITQTVQQQQVFAQRPSQIEPQMHNQQPKLINTNFQQPNNYQNNLPFNTNNVLKPYSNESQQNAPLINNNNMFNKQPKFSQQQQQPIFFPSALNRKFNSNQQNENSLNQHNLAATNSQMVFNKNRNILSAQEHHQQQLNNQQFNQQINNNVNFFNINKDNNSYQQLYKANNNAMMNKFNGNQIRANFDNFESNTNNFMNRQQQQQTIRPYQYEQNFVQQQQQLNQNKLPLNTSNQPNQFKSQQPFSLFNSSSNFDELNPMLQQNTTSSNIWPTTLPFNTNMSLDNLNQNKNNPTWSQFPLNPEPKDSKSNMDFNSTFMDLIQSTKKQTDIESNNALLSNLLFQLNKEPTANNNNSLNDEQKSIWTFPSNFN